MTRSSIWACFSLLKIHLKAPFSCLGCRSEEIHMDALQLWSLKCPQTPHPYFCTSGHYENGQGELRELREPYGSNNGWTEKRDVWKGKKKNETRFLEVFFAPTFRTTWMKSLALCGLRPCSWRVHASKEEAWATISTLFPTQSGNPGRMQRQPRRNARECKTTR